MTNAARRYKKFLRILEEWPLDSLKEDRDLGAVIRAQVSAFEMFCFWFWFYFKF